MSSYLLRSLIPYPLILPSLPHLDEIYTAGWKRRIQDYFSRGAQFAAAAGYWAFDFERQWAKHRKAVARELRLVERLGHWMPSTGWAAACW